jgi:hypothetical protein
MNPDLSALAAYGGTYERALFSTLITGLDAANDMTLYPNIKSKITLTKLTVSPGIRPYSATFQPPVNDLAYSGRVFDVQLFKRDTQIEPLKYNSSWMSQVLRPGTDPKDIPFAQYVWEQVIKGISSELNGAIYLGTYNAAGTGAADVVTGLGTLIAAEITGGNMAPVTLGAITNVNATSKFETLMKSMPAAYRKAGFSIYCSYDQFDKYNEDYRLQFKRYTELNKDGTYTIDNTGGKVDIRPATWMGTSQRLIATPKENLLLGTDLLSDLNKINTKENIYTLDTGIVGKIGVQIRDLAAMRVSEAA